MSLTAETAAREARVIPYRSETAGRLGQSLVERIGYTPLLRLERVGAEFSDVEFCAKAEWFNPGGSVKDRAALAMIREGERSGELRPGKVILDATSGNTGIAYAMIGAARIPCEIVPSLERLPGEKANPEGLWR